MLARMRSFIRTLVRRERVDGELDAEVRFHIDTRTEHYVREGMSLAEARRRARLEFGAVDKAKEEWREARGVSFLDSLAQDVRFGVRMLRKSPGFTAVAVVTLALGIGANTAIFSVVNSVVLRPLPFKNSNRIVTVDWGVESRDLSDGNGALECAAKYEPGNVNLTGGKAAERVAAAQVSESFFRTFDLNATLGRTFTHEDEAPGHPPIVILGNALWRSRYHADPTILTKTIYINGKGYTPVGVMAPQFDFPQSAQLWLPLPPSIEQSVFGGNVIYFLQIGRLRARATVAEARSELQVVEDREFAAAGNAKPSPVRVQTLHDSLVGDTREAALLLFAAVGFVALIACADVANLLLARGAGRTREMAVRRSLGATRSRLVLQLLIESLLLSVLGGALGLLLGWWAVDACKNLLPARAEAAAPVSLDAWVLAFTCALAVGTGVVAGIVPALQSSGGNFVEALKEGARSSPEGFRLGLRASLRSLLGICEIALALILAVGAALFLRSLDRLINVNPGFQPDNVMVVHLSLLGPKYATDANRTEFLRETIARARALPGVQSASFVNLAPFDSSVAMGMNVESADGRKVSLSTPYGGFYTMVSPGYFGTMEIPLLAGRDFGENDATKSAPVAIVSETVAKSLWPGRSAVGHHFTLEGASAKDPAIEVIGVAGDVHTFGLDDELNASLYFPIAQESPDEGALIIRTSGKIVPSLGAIRDVIHAIDPDEPVSSFHTMDSLLAKSVAPPRFRTLLLAIFGAVALLLAWAGIYSVISYTVAQRTHEIGIRVALGASRRDVLAIVGGYGFRLAAIGLCIGLTGAYFLAKLASSFLYSVTPGDPAAFMLGAAIVAGIVLLASYVPARRAMRVDPIVALRHE